LLPAPTCTPDTTRFSDIARAELLESTGDCGGCNASRPGNQCDSPVAQGPRLRCSPNTPRTLVQLWRQCAKLGFQEANVHASNIGPVPETLQLFLDTA
jgi:hypothetical protein